MGCGNCEQKKDQAHVEELAEKYATGTGESVQVYVETTYQGDIFGFEPLGIEREKVIKIIKIEEGKYKAISVK